MVSRWSRSSPNSAPCPCPRRSHRGGAERSAAMRLHEGNRLTVDSLDLGPIDACQPMAGAGDGDELMLDSGFCKFRGHELRLFVGDVGIIRAVNQERGWVTPRHVPKG